MDYKILCEDCKCELGNWSPAEGTAPTEEQIKYATETGYLCDNCAKARSENSNEPTI